MVCVRVAMVLSLVVVVCANPLPPHNPTDGINLLDPTNVHLGQSQLESLEDMGVDLEEAWDCDWYSSPLPRAVIALSTCRAYLDNRAMNCLQWTQGYTEEHPKADRHITAEEIYTKCRHVKDKLDQLTYLPGDTASCSWCMQNVNTN